MLVLIVVLGVLPALMFDMTDGPVQTIAAALAALG
jgi:hypothetical protein